MTARQALRWREFLRSYGWKADAYHDPLYDTGNYYCVVKAEINGVKIIFYEEYDLRQQFGLESQERVSLTLQAVMAI